MVVAEVRELNWRLPRVVKSIKLNSLPMLLMVVLVRPVRRLTLLAVNEPVICPIPSRAIVPLAVSAIAMLPSKVEQLEMAVTSAWEVIVRVAVCVQADAWDEVVIDDAPAATAARAERTMAWESIVESMGDVRVGEMMLL